MIEKDKLKNVINKLLYVSPNWLKESFGNLYLYNYLPISLGLIKCRNFYQFLKQAQWWPKWKLEQYQLGKLKEILRYAYDNVPYYSEVLKKIHFIPEDIESIRELRKLPILTKKDIVNNFDKLISRKANKKHLNLLKTSGSTGESTQFYRDDCYEFVEYGFMLRLLNLINIKISDKYIYLWTAPFIEKRINDTYLFEPCLKRLLLSTEPHSLNEHIKLIRQFRPVYAKGNPSFLYHLACYTQENNINDINFRCFLSCFENLFPYQRELIEQQFKCEAYNYYGSLERIISACECSKHEGMHVNMEKGVLEIVDNNGELLPEGCLGKMITTGFYNFAFPFIRYDIGDVGSISKIPCSCGRGLQLLKSLDGRTNEVIKYKDKHISSTALSVFLRKFKNIKQCQFIQQEENKIMVNIVRGKEYSEHDSQELVKAMQEMTDEQLNICISFVEHIPRTKMGKFNFIISKLKIVEQT